MAGISRSLLPLPVGISIRPCKCFELKSFVGFIIFNGEGEDLGGKLELLFGRCLLLGVANSLEFRRWLLFMLFLLRLLEEVVEVKECFDNNSATGRIDKDAPPDKFEADEVFKVLPSLLFANVAGTMF